MNTPQHKKTILLYQPDRYTKRKNAVEADAHFEKELNCNFLVALTWDDFVLMLNNKPDLVNFHCDFFNESDGVTNLIKLIEMTLKLKGIKANISVTINRITTPDIIEAVRKTKIVGIQLGRGAFGLDKATESWRRLLEDGSYWPEEDIKELQRHQTIEKPLHIYFKDPNIKNHSTELTQEKLDCRVRVCETWSELSIAIADRPRSIGFHIELVKRHGGTISEFMMMLDTLIKYADLTVRPNIGVAIDTTTHLSTIKELQKHKIKGILLANNSFSVDQSIESIQAIINNERYWPKDIIGKLPGNENKVKNKNTHSLTNRQQEVFDLIAKRGLSNKQIARVLNISESTVKIHVSAVMKNLCVRNRTQLALTK